MIYTYWLIAFIVFFAAFPSWCCRPQRVGSKNQPQHAPARQQPVSQPLGRPVTMTKPSQARAGAPGTRAAYGHP